jgi:hypothetical protein
MPTRSSPVRSDNRVTPNRHAKPRTRRTVSCGVNVRESPGDLGRLMGCKPICRRTDRDSLAEAVLAESLVLEDPVIRRPLRLHPVVV